LLLIVGGQPVSAEGIFTRLFGVPDPQYKSPQYEPRAHRPSADHLVVPPGERPYFLMRSDDQPYTINLDTTVNLTDWINGYYYNPWWEGENWTPFNQYEIVERSSRKMAIWKEYNEFSELRVLNPVNRFFERASGFGP
jgi:hypothetical protein